MRGFRLDKTAELVIPAEAGIQDLRMDSRLRGNDIAWLLFIVLVLTFMPLDALAQSPSAAKGDETAVLQAAEQAAASGDFVRAAELYQTLVRDRDPRDARLYANLGAVYRHSNDLGKSHWAYAVAHRLAPRDGEIAANLAALRDTLKLPAVAAEPNGWLKTAYARFISARYPGINHVSTRELLIAAIAIYPLYWLVAILCLFPFFKRLRPAWKLSTLMLILFTLWSGPKLYRDLVETRAILVGPAATAVSNYVAGQERFELQTGTEVRILDTQRFTTSRDGKPETETWTLIETETGARGWLANAALWRVKTI